MEKLSLKCLNNKLCTSSNKVREKVEKKIYKSNRTRGNFSHNIKVNLKSCHVKISLWLTANLIRKKNNYEKRTTVIKSEVNRKYNL